MLARTGGGKIFPSTVLSYCPLHVYWPHMQKLIRSTWHVDLADQSSYPGASGSKIHLSIHQSLSLPTLQTAYILN